MEKVPKYDIQIIYQKQIFDIAMYQGPPPQLNMKLWKIYVFIVVLFHKSIMEVIYFIKHKNKL